MRQLTKVIPLDVEIESINNPFIIRSLRPGERKYDVEDFCARRGGGNDGCCLRCVGAGGIRTDAGKLCEGSYHRAAGRRRGSRRSTGGRAPRPAATSGPATLAVGDGAVTHHLPVGEIEHVAAAANYVEIAWRGQTLLHRATLTAIESELASAGFVRIHRSRLVRRHAVRRVVTLKSGDFDVEMESGAVLRGSRRYRPGLDR